MADFDRLFDLDLDVSGRSLRTCLEEAIVDLDARALPDWATQGPALEPATERLEAVRFRYLPHLFPEMDLKLRLAHKLQFHLLPRDLPPGSGIRVSAVLESYCHMSGDLFGWERVDGDQVLVWIVV